MESSITEDSWKGTQDELSKKGIAQKEKEKDVIKEVSGVYHLLPLILNDMQKRHWGRVIGFASNMTIPSPAYSYNVAKSSRIEALLSSVKKAWELGVTVNVIAPDPVDAFSSFQEACAYSGGEEAWVERKKVTPQEDGRCSFWNNLSENAIRPFTVGRWNWLFSDTPKGADASSMVYTMVEMAKAHGVNIYKYLNFLLEQLPGTVMTDEELSKLVPWNKTVQAICSGAM